MNSKALFFLLFAAVLLFSLVAAENEDANLQPEQLRCRHGCCLIHKAKPNRCLRCCRPKNPLEAEGVPVADETAAETQSAVEEEVNPQPEQLRCPRGCCLVSKAKPYRCLRCCRPKNPLQAEGLPVTDETAAETQSAVEEEVNPQPEQLRCPHGCCLVHKGKPYRCLRCCRSKAEEPQN